MNRQGGGGGGLSKHSRKRLQVQVPDKTSPREVPYVSLFVPVMMC